jgi:hypothetical protein
MSASKCLTLPTSNFVSLFLLSFPLEFLPFTQPVLNASFKSIIIISSYSLTGLSLAILLIYVMILCHMTSVVDRKLLNYISIIYRKNLEKPSVAFKNSCRNVSNVLKMHVLVYLAVLIP